MTIKGDKLEAPQLLETVGQKNQKGTKKQTSTPLQKQCTQCGKDQHPCNACPAKETTCRKCQKKGHFAVMCQTKILHNVKQDNPTLDSFYLDTIHDTEDSTFWMTDVKVNNISVTFKVDRCRGNGNLRKYPTDFGSARGRHARQETVWAKWCSVRPEGKPHSNFISEAAQM